MEAYNNMPKVSIIMATYNRAHLLPHTIESVLNQTFRDFEFIIIDDGSTDSTNLLVASYDDRRIKYYYQSNKGRSAARNRAIAEASGEFIAFLDSDDLFVDTKLEAQIGLLSEQPSLGMVYTAANVIDEFGAPIAVTYTAPVSGKIYHEIAYYLPVTICLPTVLVRRSVLIEAGLFDETMERFEDTDLWRRISKITDVGAINVPLTTIRTHSGNSMEDARILYNRIDQYLRKIKTEDGRVFDFQGNCLSARLWFHYGMAVLSHPNYRSVAHLFFRKAVFEWPFKIIYIYYFLFSKFPPEKRGRLSRFVGRILRRVVFSKC